MKLINKKLQSIYDSTIGMFISSLIIGGLSGYGAICILQKIFG